MKDSIVNILSQTNNSFGTGFVIYRDNSGIYILTCKHVVEDVKIPIVEEIEATIIAQGELIDIAILHVPNIDKKPLPLQISKCNSLKVEVIGFSSFNQKFNQKKFIQAVLYKESIELHATENRLFYSVRKIKAKDGFNFDRGNSGSPVICTKTQKVIAILSNKEGTSIGYAIDIINLKKVWSDMPLSLLNSIEEISGTEQNNSPISLMDKPIVKKHTIKFISIMLLSILFVGGYINRTEISHLRTLKDNVYNLYSALRLIDKNSRAKIKIEDESEKNIKALNHISDSYIFWTRYKIIKYQSLAYAHILSAYVNDNKTIKVKNANQTIIVANRVLQLIKEAKYSKTVEWIDRENIVKINKLLIVTAYSIKVKLGESKLIPKTQKLLLEVLDFYHKNDGADLYIEWFLKHHPIKN